MDSIERMTRQRILDANDLLDAIEESEEEARREAALKDKAKTTGAVR